MQLSAEGKAEGAAAHRHSQGNGRGCGSAPAQPRPSGKGLQLQEVLTQQDSIRANPVAVPPALVSNRTSQGTSPTGAHAASAAVTASAAQSAGSLDCTGSSL